MYTLDDFSRCVDAVLCNAIQNGKRILRRDCQALLPYQQPLPATSTHQLSFGQSTALPMLAAAHLASFLSGVPALIPRHVTNTPRHHGGDMLVVATGGDNPGGAPASPHVVTADLLLEGVLSEKQLRFTNISCLNLRKI